MPGGYTLKSLSEVHDAAAEAGFADQAELRFAGGELDAQDTGFTYHRAAPNAHSGFGHRHEEAEEVYVVIGGSGRAKLDDDIVEIKRLDALRVAPQVWRSFSAGPDGLEMLAFGPRHDGDGEVDPGWWEE
jgi:mannose-6-phosphate isomerase-like protein (cupin superfamily)